MEKTYKRRRMLLPGRAKTLLTDTICYLFIFLFAYTACSKAMDYASFARALARYPMIESYAETVAWLVPASEAFVSLLLVFPRTRKIGLYASLALMLVFTAYLLHMVLTMDALPCSCGGVISSMSFDQHIVFNAGFIALALTGLWLYRPKQSMDATR